MKHDYIPATRVIIKIVQDLVRTERWECLADLTDVLKYKLAKLKIKYTNDDITKSYIAVGKTQPLTVLAPILIKQTFARQVEPIIIDKAQAAAICANLKIDVK